MRWSRDDAGVAAETEHVADRVSRRLDAAQLRRGRFHDDVVAAPAVMVEHDLERAVVHLGPDVVDHLLAGPDLDALLLADVDPYVDGTAIVDVGEGGDVAAPSWYGTRGEAPAGDGEGRERAGEEEEERAWGGHDSMFGALAAHRPSRLPAGLSEAVRQLRVAIG